MSHDNRQNVGQSELMLFLSASIHLHIHTKSYEYLQYDMNFNNINAHSEQDIGRNLKNQNIITFKN